MDPLTDFQVILIFVFCLGIILPVHELGHYLWAKKEGNYKGWGLFPDPHIKLIKPFSSRWGYLSGLVATVPLAPLWLWVFPGDYFWGFPLFISSSAIFDIVLVVFFGRLKKKWELKKK